VPQAAFLAVSEAFETLNDAEGRRLYERYGPALAKDPRQRALLAARTESDALMSMASFYVIWAVLTYLLTIGKTAGEARTWSFIGLALSLMVEFQMMFGGFDPLSSVFTRSPLHEKVALLHAMYPPFMNGARLLAQHLFVDEDAQLRMAFEAILIGNKEILVSLEQVLTAVEKKKGGQGAGASGTLALAAAGAVEPLRGDEALPLAARMARRQEAEIRLQQAAATKQGKTGGIPSWIIMAGLFVLFNYLK
jgi:hypothetical protein